MVPLMIYASFDPSLSPERQHDNINRHRSSSNLHFGASGWFQLLCRLSGAIMVCLPVSFSLSLSLSIYLSVSIIFTFSKTDPFTRYLSSYIIIRHDWLSIILYHSQSCSLSLSTSYHYPSCSIITHHSIYLPTYPSTVTSWVDSDISLSW